MRLLAIAQLGDGLFEFAFLEALVLHGFGQVVLSRSQSEQEVFEGEELVSILFSRLQRTLDGFLGRTPHIGLTAFNFGDSAQLRFRNLFEGLPIQADHFKEVLHQYGIRLPSA